MALALRDASKGIIYGKPLLATWSVLGGQGGECISLALLKPAMDGVMLG